MFANGKVQGEERAFGKIEEAGGAAIVLHQEVPLPLVFGQTVAQGTGAASEVSEETEFDFEELVENFTAHLFARADAAI
jgi:hypothetical protein